MYIRPVDKKIVGFVCVEPASGATPNPVGTCFFVMWKNAVGEDFAYIVTAKHVVDGLQDFERVSMRVDSGITPDIPSGVLAIPVTTDPNPWMFHPDASVDVAVLPWRPLSYGGRFHSVPLFLQQLNDLIPRVQAAGMHWPPLEGEDVLFLGLTTKFPGTTRNLPIVRRGSIALVTDELLPGTYGPSHHYVIQAQAYPGNSGSSVFVAAGNTLVPWGVLTFSYPAREELRRVKDEENAYYNLGLSLVTPIEKVVDILTSEKERERRDRGVEADAKGIPLSAEVEEGEYTRETFLSDLTKVTGPVEPGLP